MTVWIYVDTSKQVGDKDHLKVFATRSLWPSLNNERLTEGRSAHLVFEGTLDECIREFMAKPDSSRHLYEVHTAPQPPLVTETLSGEHIVELARLRDFL